MTAGHVLAVDLGSTGIKVALVDADGRVRAGAGEVLPLLFTDDGGAEQDPRGWWDALGRCARRAVAESGLSPADVTLVAVTSQYSSTVAVDESGAPLGNVVMWMDQRGRRHHPAVATADTVARWLEVHGLAPSGNDDIGHIALIRALWPEVAAAAHAYVEPMDHLAARLTGEVTATQSTVFPMMVADNRTWGLTEYSDELLALTGVDPATLPRLVPLGEPRGRILATAADHLGISPAAVVADATIDSVTTAVGTGAVDTDGCGLVIGTTTVMATHLDEKRYDAAHALSSAPSPLPKRWFLVAENGVGGKALDVFVNQLVHADDGLGVGAPADATQRVVEVAGGVPAGANGVLFLPWLAGSMAPGAHRRTRGGFVNVGLSTTRADLARAVLEGVALNAGWLLPHFAALAGRTYPSVTFGGGGAESALWGQILADVFGVEVRRLADPRTTNAHGAALLAMALDGRVRADELPSLLRVAEVHEPDPAAHRRYAQLLPALIDIHDRAAPFYDALALGRPETTT